MSRLRSLLVRDTAISGTAKSLKNLAQLTEVGLSFTRVTDTEKDLTRAEMCSIM